MCTCVEARGQPWEAVFLDFGKRVSHWPIRLAGWPDSELQGALGCYSLRVGVTSIYTTTFGFYTTVASGDAPELLMETFTDS